MDDGTRASYVSSSRIGRAVELLVAASCMLASRGRLTVSTPLVDDEGVDLVFSARDVPVTLSVQVKSRVIGTSSLSKGIFRTQVRDVALRPRPDVYLLFVVADADAGSFETCWLIPSEDFAARTRPNAGGIRRFVVAARAKTRGGWNAYRLERGELPGRMLAILEELAERRA